jgi:hypothetical protein
MTDSHYFAYLNAVQDWAYCFHRDLFPMSRALVAIIVFSFPAEVPSFGDVSL